MSGCRTPLPPSTEQAEIKEQLCRQYQAAAETAAEARGLALPTSLGCLPVDDAEYALYAKEIFSEDIEAGELFYAEQIYKAVGFIPEDYPYEECLILGSLRSVNAFYSPEKRAAIIPTTRDTQPSTMVHEAVHALQDAAFDLLRLKTQNNINTDSALAFSAAVEADAVLTDEQTKDLVPPFKAPGGAPKADKCDLPETLLYQYEFPYTFGVRWLKRGITEYGEEFRDRLFSELPQTSTEILYQFGKQHRLIERKTDFPVDSLPQFPSEEWRTLSSDTLGEYTIRTMLRPVAGSKAAVLAGMGWQHDTLRLLYSEAQKQPALSWVLFWATDFDAEEFFQTYRQLLLTRENFKVTSNAAGFTGSDGRRSYRLQRNATIVSLDVRWDASSVLSDRISDIKRQVYSAPTM